MKARFAIAILFLASAAFASSDVAVTLSAPSSARPGETILLRGLVENLGPDLATDVRVHMELNTYEPCVNVTIAALAAGESQRFTCETTLRGTLTSVFDAYLYALFVRFSANATGTQDPVTRNNDAFGTIDLITDPDLAVYGNVVAPATPGLPVTLRIAYGNRARTTATGVSVLITAPGPIHSAPDYCVVRGNRAACAIGRIEPAENRFNDFFRNFEIELVAPDRSETTFPVQLEINSEQPDVYPDSNVESVLGRTFRTFYVTNASDSGAGSLRAAIETANASCNAVVPCQVAFRIPDAKGPWQTIALASPLPAVTASNLSIDASTQSKYFADTNPDGPEIELDGSQVVGHGFDIQSRCEMEVAGFAINGFPGYGIYIHTPERCVQQFSGVRRVRDNAIGTDPTGMRAIPNTRGVYIAVANETTPTVIVRNIISGNRRAGIFVEHGRMTSITRNTIGLNRTITAGLGNGASGIFLDTVSHASGISDNYIGFNAEAGVAIRAGAQYIAMGGNSFQANGGLAIDHGLDGVTEMLGFPHPNIPLPIITSARFENGETIVEGTVDTSMGSVNVYANDAPDPSGYGEGQYTLGKAEAVDRRFTFVHKGDLRGKWIAATTTARFIYQLGIDGITASTTSEFGRAVEVR